MAIRHVVSLVLGFLVFLIGANELYATRHKRPWYCEQTENADQMSFLWTAKRDPPAYFFGTIHVPYTRVWDFIPDNAKQAFEASDNVFFELDLMDPRTISALAGCQMLPQGENLADLLPADMYRRLKRHLDYVKGMMPTWMTADQRGRGLYADYLFNAITGNWERKRPVWVMLMVNSLTESDVKARGIPVLDLYLAQEAERMNKRTGAVERVEEQCVPLNGLNVSQVLFALNQTLYQHESIRTGDTPATYTTDDLIKHYNCGDLNDVIFNHDTTQVPSLSNGSLSPIELTLARNIDDYFRQELIYRRNKRMGGRVAQLLRAYPDESFFFAFGAGHFLGNNTVLDFVREAGFEVEHTPPQKKIKNSTKRSRDNRKPTAASTETSAWSRLSELVPHSPNGFDGTKDTADDDRARRLGVRKRLPAHTYHSAVHLLRTTTPRPKQRKFNDLWVRLETLTTREPYMSPHEAKDSEVFQNSLRVWYGLRSTAHRSCVYRWTLVLCLVATFGNIRR